MALSRKVRVVVKLCDPGLLQVQERKAIGSRFNFLHGMWTRTIAVKKIHVLATRSGQE